MTTRDITSHHVFGSTILWTLAISGIWVAAALMRPDTTMHLGPLLVPLVPSLVGFGSGASEGEDPGRLSTAAPTLVATGIAVMVLIILRLTGDLAGPALPPFDDVAQESYVLLAVGTAIGVVVSTRKQ